MAVLTVAGVEGSFFVGLSGVSEAAEGLGVTESLLMRAAIRDFLRLPRSFQRELVAKYLLDLADLDEEKEEWDDNSTDRIG